MEGKPRDIFTIRARGTWMWPEIWESAYWKINGLIREKLQGLLERVFLLKKFTPHCFKRALQFDLFILKKNNSKPIKLDIKKAFPQSKRIKRDVKSQSPVEAQIPKTHCWISRVINRIIWQLIFECMTQQCLFFLKSGKWTKCLTSDCARWRHSLWGNGWVWELCATSAMWTETEDYQTTKLWFFGTQRGNVQWSHRGEASSARCHNNPRIWTQAGSG